MPQDSWFLDREIPFPAMPGLYHPSSIDIDSDGSIYLTEWSNDRVSQWSAEGKFESSLGTHGAADGQFYDASSIKVSGDEVFVTDWSRHNVQVFDKSGNFLRKWGSHGSGDGQFNQPIGITVDVNESGGREVYVTDYNNHRVQVFDENGTFLRKFGTYGNGDGQLNYANGVSIGPDGKVYLSSKHSNKLQVFSKDGNFSHSISTSGYPYKVDFYQNMIAVAQADHHRFQLIDLNGTSLGDFGSHGTEPGQLRHPKGLAFDSEGKLHVCEQDGHRVQVFETNGSVIREYGFFGRLSFAPYGIEVTSDSTYLLTEISGHRVWEADENGSIIQVIAGEGSADGQTNHPVDVHQSDNGRIYVCDTHNHRVQVFDRNGSFLLKIGSYGSADGQFNQPHAVVSSDGEIFVADRYNHRIQVFDDSGTFLRTLGGYGSLEGKFNQPTDVELDDLGNLLISDYNNRRIVHLRKSGEFIRQYTTPDHYDSISNMPNGLTLLSRNGYLALFDSEGTRLKQWHDPHFSDARAFALDDGSIVRVCRGSNSLKVYRQAFRSPRPKSSKAIPFPEILSVKQRDGTNYLDINYRINDLDSPKVQAAMLAFVDGGNDLSKVIVPSFFIDGVEGRLDANVSSNQEHNVTWNVAEDWSVGFGELQVEILAKDDRNLLDLHFLTLPVDGDGNSSELVINRSPLTEADLLSAWYWLLATGDPNIRFSPPSILPVLDGPAPTFSPEDYSNLVVWLDANDLDANVGTSPESNGTIVETWGNKADAQTPFSQTNTNKQPVLHTNVLNQKAGVFFDNLDDGMSSQVQINQNPYTVAILFNCLNTSGESRRAIQGSNNWLIGPYANRVGYHPDYGWASHTLPLVAQKFYLAIAITTDQESKFLVNGNDVTQSPSANRWPGYLHLGASGGSSSQRLNGYINEVIAYDRALSHTEVSQVEEYFAYKWGIIASYADGSSTTPSGRAYLFDKMNLREASSDEVQRAREGALSGSVNQFVPSFQVGPNERPNRVNEYGFDTGNFNSNHYWVVPKSENP